MKPVHRPSTATLTLALILVAASSACGLQSLIAPTETPAPTATPTPTCTPTPTPTPTETPTPTPRPTDTPRPTETPKSTPEPKLSLGRQVAIPGSGFSFRTILEYDTEVAEASVTITDTYADVIIALGGGPIDGDLTAEQAIQEHLDVLSKDIKDMESAEPETIVVDGIRGLGVDFAGELFGDDIEGRVVSVIPAAGQFFFGFGVGTITPSENHWEDEGAEAFDMIVGSVRFTKISADVGSCPTSSDATYGYTQDNPIKVGGDIFGGPARERAYLDHLRGPEGQAITYQRLGSTGYGDTILDIYEVSYDGLAEPILLYTDMYVFEDLFSPVGFTCAGPFPLQSP
jgi:hypothetical protein